MKKLGFATLAFLTVFLAIELGARLVFALRVGPSVLLYGTPFERAGTPSPRAAGDDDDADERAELGRKHSVMVHTNQQRGYSKYYPNQERVDYDQQSGEIFDVAINSQGFRGNDFTQRKSLGVVRVLTLGASSTFGYYSRDDQTYPAALERELNARCLDQQRYEVINFGIPHLDSQNIAALFLTEGLSLDPDVVTFYEGVNDTNSVVVRTKQWDSGEPSAPQRLGQRASDWLADHFVTIGFARSLLEGGSAPLNLDVFDTLVRDASRNLQANLEHIRRGCERVGAGLVVATQQATSTTLDPVAMRTTSYEREAELVRERVERTGEAETSEMRLLAHRVFMNDLVGWARNNEIAWVDGIAALDDDRSVLLSWVHLSPAGNEKLAHALSEPILQRTCTRVAEEARNE